MHYLNRTFIYCLLASLTIFPALLVSAASNTFTVRVGLVPNAPQSNNAAFCQSDNSPADYGSIVTVVCETGAVVDRNVVSNHIPWKPINGDTYRFVKHFNIDVNHYGIVNSNAINAYTSWRTVYLKNNDYIELLVSW